MATVSNTHFETRNSLILRLSDKQDIEAWDRFVEIYQPLIFRLVRSKGFQDADADDIVQEVMVAVSKAIERWEPDPIKGRFRDWLFRIARNLMINFLTRRKHQAFCSGRGMFVELLDEQLEQVLQPTEASQEFDLEYRRELFLIGAERVSQSVRTKTWDAFRLTAIEHRSISDAARELQMTEGAVLVARCRVLARLRDVVKSLEGSDSIEGKVQR
jgi:RNA polymerase sigma factor (sigma-70 family)